MTQAFFFPDNTVLINFTLLKRQDLVTWFTAKGVRQWTLSVCRECANSAKYEDLKAMTKWTQVFGTPLSPSKTEVLIARQIADAMRMPGEYALSKHMGEAETIAIAESRYANSIFLTDDHEAARVAESRHIQAVSTTKIIAFAEVGGKILHDEAQLCIAELMSHKRILGGSPEPIAYDGYVRSLRRRHEAIAKLAT